MREAGAVGMVPERTELGRRSEGCVRANDLPGQRLGDGAPAGKCGDPRAASSRFSFKRRREIGRAHV